MTTSTAFVVPSSPFSLDKEKLVLLGTLIEELRNGLHRALRHRLLYMPQAWFEVR